MNYVEVVFFDNNVCGNQLISFDTSLYNVFPYCVFQYITLTSDVAELSRFYVIHFSGNKLLTNDKSTFYPKNAHDYNINLYNFFHYLSHCKWLPTAVFKGHNPGDINQQIIQVDGHQWVDHKTICYCPRNEDYNCTVDLLGPVYPGQLLQVDLCIPQEDDRDSIVYVETHANSLPSSACKIAHQTELINIIDNYSKTFNFTIISESKLFELTMSSWIHITKWNM